MLILIDELNIGLLMKAIKAYDKQWQLASGQ